MPALFTHYEFGIELLNKLDDNIKNKIASNIEYYNMFNQGWDNLFYYPWRWKHYRKVAGIAHKKKVDIFFYNAITYIKNNHLEDNSSLTNMIYGFINHYTVDTIIHPFVNYQVRNLKIPHSKIEFMIDTKIKKDKSNKYFKKAIPKLKFNKELKGLIDYTFFSTHNEKNVGKVFNKSHNNSYYLYRYFINDKHGIKAFFYKIIDTVTPFLDIKLHELTYYYKAFDGRILNNENNTWHHPRDDKEEYNYSFKELYDYTTQICLNLNTIAYDVIYKDRNIEDLLKLIRKIDIKNIQELLN